MEGAFLQHNVLAEVLALTPQQSREATPRENASQRLRTSLAVSAREQAPLHLHSARAAGRPARGLTLGGWLFWCLSPKRPEQQLTGTQHPQQARASLSLSLQVEGP